MELPYDGDTNDPSQYCKHGTFIGSWWGPDYLCHWCEMGISVEDQIYYSTWERVWDLKRRIADTVPIKFGKWMHKIWPTLDHRAKAHCVIALVPESMKEADDVAALQAQYRTAVAAAIRLPKPKEVVDA